VLAVLVVAASTTALAAPQAPQAPQAVAAPCDDLAARIAGLQATADRASALIARVEQRLAAGGLRPLQRAVLRVELRILQQTLDGIEARIDRLQARFDAECGGGGGEEQPPPGGGGSGE
jgi:hypothetical protein